MSKSTARTCRVLPFPKASTEARNVEGSCDSPGCMRKEAWVCVVHINPDFSFRLCFPCMHKLQRELQRVQDTEA